MQALDKIGPYQVVRKLGAGGMGEVYEARHTAIERRVAIKVLRPTLAENPEMNGRFINEARAVNFVDHPGIVQISDYGHLDDGRAYIVMEYLQGVTLANHMASANGQLPAEDALRFARMIGAVLVAAHAKGIIHRDLKPDNVMLIPDPDPDDPWRVRVKLLDFGVAKLAGSLEPGSGPGTRDSAVIGTPEYMSPEQARDSGKVSDKTDVYSLGIILYEMLAGRVPFESASATEVLAMHMYEPLPPLRRLAPEAPSQLIELIEQMLAKAPDKRPTMDQLMTLFDKVATALGKRAARRSRPGIPIVIPSENKEPSDPRAQTSAALAGPVEPKSIFAQRSWRSGLTLVATMGLVAWGGWILLGKGTLSKSRHTKESSQPRALSADSASARPVSSELVHWLIRTNPPGAQIVQVDKEKLLGVTPWHGSMPRGSGSLVLRLQLTGYESQLISLNLGQDLERQETLTPLAATLPPPSAPPDTAAAARTRSANKSAKKLKKRQMEEPEVEE